MHDDADDDFDDLDDFDGPLPLAAPDPGVALGIVGLWLVAVIGLASLLAVFGVLR